MIFDKSFLLAVSLENRGMTTTNGYAWISNGLFIKDIIQDLCLGIDIYIPWRSLYLYHFDVT
jgi:hypothetical protein